jgi:hypothetical protein
VGTLATVLGAALRPLFGGAAGQYSEAPLQAPDSGWFLLMLIPAVGALVFLPDKRRDVGTGLTINYVGMAVPSPCAGVAVTAVGFSTAVAAFTTVGVLLCALGLVVSPMFAAEKARKTL